MLKKIMNLFLTLITMLIFFPITLVFADINDIRRELDAKKAKLERERCPKGNAAFIQFILLWRKVVQDDILNQRLVDSYPEVTEDRNRIMGLLATYDQDMQTLQTAIDNLTQTLQPFEDLWDSPQTEGVAVPSPGTSQGDAFRLILSTQTSSIRDALLLLRRNTRTLSNFFPLSDSESVIADLELNSEAMRLAMRIFSDWAQLISNQATRVVNGAPNQTNNIRLILDVREVLIQARYLLNDGPNERLVIQSVSDLLDAKFLGVSAEQQDLQEEVDNLYRQALEEANRLTTHCNMYRNMEGLITDPHAIRVKKGKRLPVR